MLFFVWSALSSQLFAAAQEITGSQDMTTLKRFLPLPSRLSGLYPLEATFGGFENKHITILSVNLLTTPTASTMSETVYYTTMPSATRNTLIYSSVPVPISSAGNMYFGWNDTFYTHQLVQGGFNGYTRAHCEIRDPRDPTWMCNSAIVTGGGTTVAWDSATETSYFDVTVSSFPYSAVPTEHPLHTVIFGSYVLRPPSSTPATATAFADLVSQATHTSVVSIASPVIARRTVSAQTTDRPQTSNERSAKCMLTTSLILFGLAMSCCTCFAT